MLLPAQRTIMAGLDLPVLFLLFSSSFLFGSSLKIAFIGDTGIDGDETYHGYGHRTFDLIVDQGVDLVVNGMSLKFHFRCYDELPVSLLTSR
jgi:hypothetical protein